MHLKHPPPSPLSPDTAGSPIKSKSGISRWEDRNGRRWRRQSRLVKEEALTVMGKEGGVLQFNVRNGGRLVSNLEICVDRAAAYSAMERHTKHQLWCIIFPLRNLFKIGKTWVNKVCLLTGACWCICYWGSLMMIGSLRPILNELQSLEAFWISGYIWEFGLRREIM